ncbi:winged helix-turn-helix domain-containing protein [Vibrio sp. S4M6]|uniref:winged helix-turn-helix domain-containing protein n=1 Tax=Vibrio sinus TaxID=2946865 RepID=UPI00202A0225|nr:winged helix-turn-helix domain-containing protein [Vibrio sinus]MCL9781620.1 winged helix-turn-helix domain-containing protein [Vibrio sinus]
MNNSERIVKIDDDLFFDSNNECLINKFSLRIHLKFKEAQFIRLLIENAGKPVAKNDIMAYLWPKTIVTDASYNKLISDLRKKIKTITESEVIVSVPRVGYKIQKFSYVEAAASSVMREKKGGKLKYFGVVLNLFAVITSLMLVSYSLYYIYKSNRVGMYVNPNYHVVNADGRTVIVKNGLEKKAENQRISKMGQAGDVFIVDKSDGKGIVYHYSKQKGQTRVYQMEK